MKRYGMLALVLLLSGRTAFAQVPVPPGQGGSVTGVLRTAAGQPAAGIRMAAMARLEPVNARGNASEMTSLAMTDEFGRYRLENISPGQYFIAAGRVDNPTYYPGTLDAGARTLVSVTAGEIVSGIDFTLLDASRGAPAGRGVPRGGQLFNNFQAQRQGGPPSTGTAGRVPPPGPSPPGARRGGRGPRSNTPPNTPANPPVSAAWWTDTALVSRLSLTNEQKKKIENIFEQYRQNLISSRLQLESGEALLSGMLAAETFDPKQALQVIDRVIQARGDMEKSYARMTLDMRQALTRVQWAQLQTEVDLDAPYQRKR